MTEQHPLTDKICDALWDEHGQYYALYEEVRLTCRAAADWQLEQVMEWGYKHLYPDQVNALREAMRPQQQEDNC